VGQLCDVVLTLDLSKDVVHEGHTYAICSALSGQKFGHWFYQDARCHVARVSMDFLNDNHIRILPWPALSPDLKLIKDLWDELGRRVRNGLNPPETLDELRRALIQEWNNIPQTFIRNLIGRALFC
jgi:hypothetical protein